MENRFYEVLEREDYRGGTEPTVATKLKADPRGDLVISLVSHWGVIAAIPDGEDSAGRVRLRLQTPEELVSRACAVAEAVFAAMEEREWLVHIPVPKLPEPREKATK